MVTIAITIVGSFFAGILTAGIVSSTRIKKLRDALYLLRPSYMRTVR
jgi:uncharacterized integral membrane protein